MDDDYRGSAYEYPWEALDEHAARLGLSTGEFVVQFKDDEERTREAYVRSRVSRMHAAGMLQFDTSVDPALSADGPVSSGRPEQTAASLEQESAADHQKLE